MREGEYMDSLERAREVLAEPKAANYAQVAIAYALIALVEQMRGRPDPASPSEKTEVTPTAKANES